MTGRALISICVSLFLGLGVTACKDGKPSGTIPQEKFTEIMRDLQIAYAGVDATVADFSARNDYYEKMNSQVLGRHSVSKETFSTSYDFYQSQPELMDSIFLEVIDLLNEGLAPTEKQARPIQPGGPMKGLGH